MNTWKVTLKTGAHQWSTVTVMCQTHYRATVLAKKIVGDFPVTNIT